VCVCVCVCVTAFWVTTDYFLQEIQIWTKVLFFGLFYYTTTSIADRHEHGLMLSVRASHVGLREPLDPTPAPASRRCRSALSRVVTELRGLTRGWGNKGVGAF